ATWRQWRSARGPQSTSGRHGGPRGAETGGVATCRRGVLGQQPQIAANSAVDEPPDRDVRRGDPQRYAEVRVDQRIERGSAERTQWGGQMVVHPLATQCRGDTSGREGVAAVLTFVVDHPRPETIECGRNAPDAQSLSEITPEHESGLVLGCGQWLRPHQGQQAFGFEYLGRQHVAVLVLVDGEPGVDGVDPVDRLLPPRAAVP